MNDGVIYSSPARDASQFSSTFTISDIFPKLYHYRKTALVAFPVMIAVMIAVIAVIVPISRAVREPGFVTTTFEGCAFSLRSGLADARPCRRCRRRELHYSHLE
jgi:hypothetical protein